MNGQRLSRWGLAALLAVLLALLAGCGGSSETEAVQAPTTAAAAEEPGTQGAPAAPATPDEKGGTNPDLTLPRRPGAKPDVTNGVPHVQLDQSASIRLFRKLSRWAFSLEDVVRAPSQTSLAGARALTVASALPANPEAVILDREFAHIHPGGSLHLRLPAGQAAEVVDTGWGEWHPFALDGTVPNLVMVYAPVTGRGLESVQTIIEAAVEYATTTA